ncbi:MAG: mechanosensitive ion channel family protein [Candidatus Methanoplasma sp.]|jgi:small-conductance mechanosensitive channel|nr:mechanosensitive ion channel family protein [Candidatus Methanoplasma sp.]
MRARGTAIVILVAVLSVLVLSVPASSVSSGLDPSDVGISSYDDSLVLSAGSSESFDIIISNYLPYQASGLDNRRMVTIAAGSIRDVTISFSRSSFDLGGQDHIPVTVHVSADRYAHAGDYSVSLVLSVKTLQPDSTVVVSAPYVVGLKVSSDLSSDDAFNKVLGIFENPFPAPFNTAITSTLVTFVLWIVIGILLIEIALPLAIRILLFGNRDVGISIKREVRRLAPLVLLLYAFGRSLRVYGASEEIIGSLDIWFNILYVILGAYIIWRLYSVFVQAATRKAGKDGRAGGVEVGPVLRLFGKLVITVFATMMLMSALGFNLTAVITGAGIVSLGITLGAQNILNQFFSGIVLLVTHPFKTGDLVRIGTTAAIYEVRGVNIMNTLFKNQDNEECIVMPNNAVASATITNITKENDFYKVYLYMAVAYGTDLDKAKKLMLDVAMAHPRVVKSGVVGMPGTGITSLDASSVEVRLSVYIDNYDVVASTSRDLREGMYRAFVANGIQIPFPQVDVHLDSKPNTGP